MLKKKNHFLAVAVKAFSINLSERFSVRFFQEQVIPYWTISTGCLPPCRYPFRTDGNSLLSAKGPQTSYHYDKTGYYLVTPGEKGDADNSSKGTQENAFFFKFFIFKSILFAAE